MTTELARVNHQALTTLLPGLGLFGHEERWNTSCIVAKVLGLRREKDRPIQSKPEF